MSEHGKQAAFLKRLMEYDDSAETRLLLERLSVAERNEHCLFSACRLVGVVGFVGLSGLGYAAVLLPEFFENSSHFLIQFFSALGLGSLMCMVAFVGLWLWYRGVANRVREDCRSSVTQMIESRIAPEACRTASVIRLAPYVSACRIDTVSIARTAEIVSFRKAS